MRYMILRRTILVLLGAAFLACRAESEAASDISSPLMTFDTARVRLVSKADTISLMVELARTANQRTMGLMERLTLSDSAGMLFMYDATQPATAGFWMFRTRIPLDIAFLDSTGVIRSIRHMEPCQTATAQNCPTYAPDVPYRAALEVNAGLFAKRGVGIGDRVLLSDTSMVPPRR